MAIVLKQRPGFNSDIFERAGDCPPIRIFGRRLDRTRELIYLQDSTVPTHVGKRREYPPSLGYLANLWLYALNHRPTARAARSPEPSLSISLESINGGGYFVSSLWPPNVRFKFYWFDEENLPLGKRVWQLHIRGPQKDSAFFIIFANGRHYRFAIRTKVQWGKEAVKAYEITFCELGVEYHGTALEHCCNTKMVGKPHHSTKTCNGVATYPRPTESLLRLATFAVHTSERSEGQFVVPWIGLRDPTWSKRRREKEPARPLDKRNLTKSKATQATVTLSSRVGFRRKQERLNPSPCSCSVTSPSEGTRCSGYAVDKIIH
jgi:hypothetical protein